ncbi:MAG TPA: glycosyltransferase family 9 protein [Candidatus Rubrimentiphilum sp.]|nr:glycosyltransferase family 9 protein [Candidatus Rubrimentiphilum sp.]
MKGAAERRYLVIAPQGLGDSLEATPIVRALRTERPDARIDVAVTRVEPKLLFESLPAVTNVHYLPYWDRGTTAFLKALAKRAERYDASFLSYPSAGLPYEFLSARFQASRRFAHRHRAHSLLDLPFLRATLVPVRPAHNVERNRDLLRAAGITPDDLPGYLIPPPWVAPDGERRESRIAVHVGSIAHSNLALRRWPLEHFIALAKRLVREYDDVKLVVGPAETEESAHVVREVPGITTFEGSLPQVARFLSTCAAVIANDSGIAHLAAGVGAPTVTLFGPTPPEQTAPFSPLALVVRPSDCPPCFDMRRPVVRCIRNIDFRCLKHDLTVDVAEAAVRNAVNARAGLKSNAL